MMKIEKNIPIPAGRSKWSEISAAAEAMEKGDSVFVSAKDPNYTSKTRSLYNALLPNAKVRTIREYCTNKGVIVLKGKRIWKVSR